MCPTFVRTLCPRTYSKLPLPCRTGPEVTLHVASFQCQDGCLGYSLHKEACVCRGRTAHLLLASSFCYQIFSQKIQQHATVLSRMAEPCRMKVANSAVQSRTHLGLARGFNLGQLGLFGLDGLLCPASILLCNLPLLLKLFLHL